MLGSTVLDVAIGVVLTFLGISLATSAATEAISSLLKLRQRTLLSGIEALLNDKTITLALYNHALVNPLASGAAATLEELSSKPAYVEAGAFATALFHVLFDGRAVPEAIAEIADPQLKQALGTLWAAADEDVGRFKDGIGRWFDGAMDRLSGWYKQRTQVISFAAALLLAISANANILYEGGAIWSRPGVIAEIARGSLDKVDVALAKACDFKAPRPPAGDPARPACFDVGDALDGLRDGNLIGWSNGPAPHNGISWAMAVLSWLLVAGAALFGAPFWFDMLQRITQLRGTGLVPRRTDGGTSKPDIAGRR